MLRIEVFCNEKNALGEGPLWDVKEQRLYWIDSYGPTVFRCDANGGDLRSWRLPAPVGSLALRRNGGAVVSLRSGFHALDFETGDVSLIAETQPGELTARLNDGKVDRQGRFVAGSMDFEERNPVGKLFRLDPDLSVHELDSGIICSNGPCWSLDGRTLYFADSGANLIYAYEYDAATGDVRSRRVFANFDVLRGMPDGATVDSEGYVWSCEVYSGRLIRFDPDGVVDRIVGLPVNSTTSLTFGGADLDIAYVTSMARPHGGAYHREREAGCVFAVHGLGVRGVPEPRFEGLNFARAEDSMKIEVLVDVKTTLGEGPLWDVGQQRLYWIDAAGMRVFRATAQGSEIRAWDVPSRVGSIAIRKDGSGAICSLAKGFYALDFATGDCTLIAEIEADKPDNWINDGKVDRRGRFFAGTMDTQESSPSGALYRLDPDFSVTRVETGIIVSNGPCWSPDDKVFYFADSWSGEIWAYDYDVTSGTVSNRRTFTKIDTSGGGAADGSTVDAEGCLWNANVYDSKLYRYTPDGKVERIIEMPVKKVTSVNFGGPELDVLYVTSMAAPPLPRFPGDGVLRGSLFAITGLGVKGVPEPRFGA